MSKIFPENVTKVILKCVFQVKLVKKVNFFLKVRILINLKPRELEDRKLVEKIKQLMKPEEKLKNLTNATNCAR